MHHLLPHTISVQRATVTIGDNGAAQPQRQTHLAAVKARVQPRTSRDAAGERPTQARRLRMYVDRTHDIRLTDRVIYNGDTFNIDDVRDDGAFLIVDVQEVHT